MVSIAGAIVFELLRRSRNVERINLSNKLLHKGIRRDVARQANSGLMRQFYGLGQKAYYSIVMIGCDGHGKISDCNNSPTIPGVQYFGLCGKISQSILLFHFWDMKEIITFAVCPCIYIKHKMGFLGRKIHCGNNKIITCIMHFDCRIFDELPDVIVLAAFDEHKLTCI